MEYIGYSVMLGKEQKLSTKSGKDKQQAPPEKTSGGAFFIGRFSKRQTSNVKILNYEYACTPPKIRLTPK